MSVQEIIAEINKLSPVERQEVMAGLNLLKKPTARSLAELAKAEGVKAEDVWDILERYAGTLDGLPEDMAINHDHYLYGTPKRNP